jgi:superfamily II DNA or RNA helicase
MSDEDTKFVLVGHDCPLGGYPSIVVPVGKVGEQLVVLYSSSAGSERVPVSNGLAYVPHSERTIDKLSEFDDKRHGLFAFDEQSLMLYIAGKEGEFFAELLKSAEGAVIEPFYRFSLAKEARQPDLIKKAFEECVLRLRSESPQFEAEWIRDNFRSEFDPSNLRPVEQLIASRRLTMPILFLHRGQSYPYAVLRQQAEFGLAEYDIVAPPRRFFSGIDPVPSAVEIGIDARRLQPLASPAELLATRLPEADNWPAHSRRSLAKLWAWFLICEDPQRRLESREVETLAHQASLVRHVLDSPNLNRVLIADEVGLGKTIEAGLIISELLERQPGLRVLYLAPARLTANVHREFTKLGLRFRRWTSGESADANLEDDRIVASIHRAAYESNVEKVVEAQSWDILVVDECHHLSNYGPDANKPTRQYQLVQKLVEKRADGRVILMSGTPHQGNPIRFKNLLRLLRGRDEPEEAVAGRVIYRTKGDVRGWNDEPLFPLRQVNQPRIIPITTEYAEWLDKIHEFYVPDSDELHGGASRNARRRAAGWRCAQALQWAASSVQAGLGYLVRQALRLDWSLDRPELEKAIISIRPYRLGTIDEPVTQLFDRIKKEVGQSQTAEIDDIEELEDEDRWAADPKQLSNLLRAGVDLLEQVADTKWQFIDREVLTPAGNEQVVLFAQPIETVTALAGYLERRNGVRPALIVGGQSDIERDQEVKKFWAKQTQFMVSSRAGSEGINLQCAHRLVHVDVPWNPMEMEQRVGRVHRFGSQRTILVDTVVLQNTREERAYAVAYEKLKQIARLLTIGQERFEELFARVMSLIPPAELQDIMSQAAMGPLSSNDSARIAALVEAGFSNWRTFHEQYHAEHRLRVPDPGQATWEDLERFAKQHMKAKPVGGFSSLKFDRRDKKEIVSSLEDIPVLEFPDGLVAAFADIGGRPVIAPEGKSVVPAGLNVPSLAATLRSVGFPDQPSGAAFLRWSESALPPALVPRGVVGVIVLARMLIGASSGTGLNEHGTTLHLQLVPQNGAPTEIGAPESGAIVRSILAASIRSKPDASEEMLNKIGQAEAAFIQQYRRRSDDDLEAGLRYAVFPLFAAVATF